MLHSASSKACSGDRTGADRKGSSKVMTDALSGDLAPQRAALVLALVAGFSYAADDCLSALAEAETIRSYKVLAPMFQQLIEGTQPGR